MRKISVAQIAVFVLFVALAAVAALLTTAALGRYVPHSDFRGILLTVVGILLLYGYAILIYRLFLRAIPLREGQISEGSGQEFVYHVYLLFFLVLFYPVMRSGIVPVPLMRLFYLALGAKLGANTYSSGILLDPPFIHLGDNTLVGQFALLVPHVIEGSKLAHNPIRVGRDVTIGAGAIVLSGVTIGDDAIVSTGAVVTKGTEIGPKEIWGGVPAKLLGRKP